MMESVPGSGVWQRCIGARAETRLCLEIGVAEVCWSESGDETPEVVSVFVGLLLPYHFTRFLIPRPPHYVFYL